MIARYSRKEIRNIWSEENKYKIWLEVEIAAAQAMEKNGQIPKGVASTVRKKGKINGIDTTLPKNEKGIVGVPTGLTFSSLKNGSFAIKIISSGVDSKA